MDIHSYIRNGSITVRVVPNAGRSEIIEEHGRLKVYLNAVADRNKANRELIKFFKKELGVAVEIKVGLRSREKVLRVLWGGDD